MTRWRKATRRRDIYQCRLLGLAVTSPPGETRAKPESTGRT